MVVGALQQAFRSQLRVKSWLASTIGRRFRPALSAERERRPRFGGWQMNRRELLRDVGVAAAAASPLLASGAGRAQDRTAQANVLIAYHSVTGNTEKMAQGVAEGAKAVADTNIVLKRVGEVAADDLLSSDAVIVGS